MNADAPAPKKASKLKAALGGLVAAGRSMIRWKYAAPRLILVGCLCLVVYLGLDELVRRTLISAGQSVTGAKVEIGNLDASVLGTSILLEDIRVADPRRPSKNLIEVAQIRLDLDAGSLLRRKLIASEGKLSGLRIQTDRLTSGELEPGADWNWDLPGGHLSGLSHDWLDRLTGVLQNRIEEEIENLESVRLTRELIRRWPAEFEQLEARADSLKRRTDRISELLQSRSNDLMESLQAYREAAVELESLHRELAELGSELDRLPQQALADKDAVIAAQRRDVERVRRTLPQFDLDAETLSTYLLGDELSRRVRSVAGWVRWARRNLTGGELSEPARGRGIDVLFAGLKGRPDFLVHSLSLDGTLEIGDQQYQFLGTASGLTNQPALYGRPTIVGLELTGAFTTQVEIVLDRSGETPHYRIVINCPDLTIPKRILGDEDRFAVAVSPGNTHLWIELDVRGEELSGQILLRQEPVHLAVHVKAEGAGRQLAGHLQTMVGHIHTIEAAVDLSGTLQEPAWRFRSNLGPQLVEGFTRVVRQELELRRDQLAEQVASTIDGQLARFDQAFLTQQATVLDKLQLGDTEIQQIGQMIAGQVPVSGQFPVSVQTLGRKLTDRLPLRF